MIWVVHNFCPYSNNYLNSRQFLVFIFNWRINQVASPANSFFWRQTYSFVFKWPFHLCCYVVNLFHSDLTNTIFIWILVLDLSAIQMFHPILNVCKLDPDCWRLYFLDKFIQRSKGCCISNDWLLIIYSIFTFYRIFTQPDKKYILGFI